jgi:hypothetical protein
MANQQLEITQKGIKDKIKDLSLEDLLVIPLGAPIVVLLTLIYERWISGKLTLWECIQAFGLILASILVVIGPMFIIKSIRIQIDEKTRHSKVMHAIEEKAAKVKLAILEVRNVAEMEAFKSTTNRKVELLIATVKHAEARTTLKNALALGMFADFNVKQLEAYSSLTEDDNVIERIDALEVELRNVQEEALDVARESVSSLSNVLTNIKIEDIDYEEDSVEDRGPIPETISNEESERSAQRNLI